MKIQYAFEKAQYRTDEDVEEQLGPLWKKKVFEVVLNNILAVIYPKGLTGSQARSCNRVLDALDNAADNNLTLSVADAEFLKTVFFNEKATVPPGQSRSFCLIQDAIEIGFKQPHIDPVEG